MFRTVLINFGTEPYRGESLDEAKRAAERCGFEAAIYGDNWKHIASYSPISGWKTFK